MRHAALCSPLIMVCHPDNTIPHLQDYINWQVRIVQDSASVSLFMMMSWHRNAFLITRTLWRESTGDSRCHRSHVMDCNLKWALIKHILTQYNPQFSYAWRKSRIMVWHGSSICPSVLPSIDIWISIGVTTCPTNFNFIGIIHLVHPQVQDTGNGPCSSLNTCTLTQWLIFAFWSFVRPFFKLEPSDLVLLEH